MSLRLLPKPFSIVLITAVAGSLAGCNLQDTSLPSGTVTPAIRGTVMGGETPIEGAKVILWQTTSSGYGSSSAVQLATTTTLVGGGFAFTPGYTCASGQYVYLTSTGGDVANNPSSPMINNNVVLMAALGSCSNFATSIEQASVNIMVNEVSTVAAAYTLGNFITVNQNTAGNQLVYVGAPANNNAATGSCTGTGTSMTCVAAGLGHAFANAANLVNDVNYNATAPTGLAYTTVPGNSLGSVPQAEVNALADIMQSCTNSGGGVAGDGSNCGNFFTDATPVVGAVPTDTLSAMLDIAKNPRNNVGSTCTGTSGGLFCLLPSSGAAFQPVLSAVPHDWTLAIVYTGVGNLSTNTAFGVPYYLTLDANDNVYVLTANLFTPTSEGQAAMTSNGTGIWADPMTTAQCVPGTLAVDTNGYVWESVEASSTSACAFAIYGYSTATGAAQYSFQAGSGTVCNTSSPTPSNCPGFTAYDTVHEIQSTANALGFDRMNNLWYGRKSSTCTNCLFELPYTAGSPGTYGGPTNIQNTMVDLNQIMIDPDANIWVGNVVTSGDGTLYVLPNTSPSTPNTPTYAASPGFLSATLPATDDGGIALDASGNIWSGSTDNVSEFTPTFTSGEVTAFGTATNTTSAASKPYPGEVDGGGVFWYGSYTSSGDVYYQLTPASPQYSSTTPTHNTSDFLPCYAPAGASACSSTVASGDPRVVQVDSAGALWIAAQQSSSDNQGFIVQLFGPATPTWPQLSYGVFGVEPH